MIEPWAVSGAMDVNTAEQVAAILCATPGVTSARVYKSDKATTGAMVRARVGGMRLSVYHPDDVAEVLARIALNKAAPTLIERIQAADGYSESQGGPGQGQLPDQGAGADPLNLRK